MVAIPTSFFIQSALLTALTLVNMVHGASVTVFEIQLLIIECDRCARLMLIFHANRKTVGRKDSLACDVKGFR